MNSTLTCSDAAVLDRLFDPAYGTPFANAPPPPPAKPTVAVDASVLADEARAVQLAEQSDQLSAALELLNDVVGRAPEYASALNNRAQVLQLLRRPDDAMADLSEAIRIADANGDAAVARQAYTQRALLRRVRNDDEGARIDFETAARLGNPLAKREAVKMNPYAQLCNQMVAVAMKAHLEQQ